MTGKYGALSIVTFIWYPWHMLDDSCDSKTSSMVIFLLNSLCRPKKLPIYFRCIVSHIVRSWQVKPRTLFCTLYSNHGRAIAERSYVTNIYYAICPALKLYDVSKGEILSFTCGLRNLVICCQRTTHHEIWHHHLLNQWKFAFVSLGRPEYLQDLDVVSNRFQVCIFWSFPASCFFP